jgi:hypothetical protein
MEKLHYYDYPTNKPETPGMYIIVLEMFDGSGKAQTVHQLWGRNEDGWVDEDNVDLSSMVAYAGPLNKYKED